MNLEKLIESHYAPKKGNELLIKLIESKLSEQITNIEVDQPSVINPKDPMFYGDERTLKLPIIRFSKQIGEKNNYERSFLDLIIKNLKQVTGTPGEKLSSRIKSIQNFFDVSNIKDPNIKISNIMAYCMISDAFYHLINDYDATVSGDLYESLFAALFEGSIVQAAGGGRNYAVEDVIIFDDTSPLDVSLKLVGEYSSSIKQSYGSILQRIYRKQSITYVVSYKNLKESSISFYSFYLGTDNLLDIVSNLEQLIGGSKNYNILRTLNKQELITFLIKNLQEYEELKKKHNELLEVYKTAEEFNIDVDRLKSELASYEQKKSKLYADRRLGNINGADFQDELQDIFENTEKIKSELDRLEELKPYIIDFEDRGDLQIKVTKEDILNKGEFLGKITYDKKTLEDILKKYSDIVNKQIINIYDNLTLLGNSINDFFLKGQGEDEQLAKTSIDKAREVESSIKTYIPKVGIYE